MPTYKDEKTGLWYCKFVYKDWTGKSKQKIIVVVVLMVPICVGFGVFLILACISLE